VKYLIAIIFLSIVLWLPVSGQTSSNPTLIMYTIDLPYEDFNKVARDTIIVTLDEPHTISWQVAITNDLLYGNPNGNAVLRLYDTNIEGKFIEIGMGGPPDDKFWVALNLPGKEEYIVINKKLERGWVPGASIILAYTDAAGVTINNGERIVVSNLNIDDFVIGSYSVHGMESSTDPPAVTAGILIVEFISGDPSANPLSLFPFVLAGTAGIILAILLITKKRS